MLPNPHPQLSCRMSSFPASHRGQGLIRSCPDRVFAGKKAFHLARKRRRMAFSDGFSLYGGGTSRLAYTARRRVGPPLSQRRLSRPSERGVSRGTPRPEVDALLKRCRAVRCDAEAGGRATHGLGARLWRRSKRWQEAAAAPAARKRPPPPVVFLIFPPQTAFQSLGTACHSPPRQGSLSETLS